MASLDLLVLCAEQLAALLIAAKLKRGSFPFPSLPNFQLTLTKARGQEPALWSLGGTPYLTPGREE